MQFWLLKTEPSTWSWENQVLDGVAMWDGVRNYQARNNMMKMKMGDLSFFYHSVLEKSIVGVVEIVKEFYADPTDKTNKFVVVDVKENKPLQVVDNIDLMSSNILMVYNKIDLMRNIKYSNKNGEAVYVSALNNTGISKLKKNILIKLNMEKIPNKLSGVSTPRQYECIQNSIKSVEEANNILTNLFQLELICYELENALININSLLGVNTEDLVLNTMFDSFCVGK